MLHTYNKKGLQLEGSYDLLIVYTQETIPQPQCPSERSTAKIKSLSNSA